MTAPVLRPLSVVAVLFAVAALAAWPAPALADGVVLPGVEKQGSNDAGSTTEVTAGTWRGTIGPGAGDHLFYEYHRTMENSTVHFGVIASKRTDESEGVGISVTPPDSDDECDSDTGSAFGTDALAFSAVARVGMDPDDEGMTDEELDDECKTGTKLVIELGRGSQPDSVDDLDVALTILEEAAVRDSAGLPAGVEIAEYHGPEGGEAVEDGQGGSLADPTPLEGGQSAKGSVQTGTSVVYSVPVDWGQSLDARVVANPVADDISFSNIGVTVLDPRFGSDYAEGESGYLSSSEKATATAVSGPVRYLNRIDGDGPYLPGTYYVVVTADAVDGSQVDVPFTLDLAVTGERAGEPAYGTDEPFVFGDGSAGETVEPAGPGGGWSLARLGAVAALTLVGAISLSGGVLLLRRR